jgi:hypothetical protein
MNEFLLIFRNSAGANEALSPEQLQNMMKPWQDWMGGLAAQNKLVSPGNRLMHDGKVVKTNMVTDGPYVETKEAVGGYTIIKADSLEEATELSKNCPIIQVGGSVEVRMIVPMD